MNILKRIGSLCAVFGLAAIASTAHAQGLGTGPWTYSWGGDLVGAVSASPNDGGNGGLFKNGTLTDSTGKVITMDSYCNDLAENISGGSTFSPVQVYQFSNLTAAQMTSLVSLNGNGAALSAGAQVTYTPTGSSTPVTVSGQSKIDALEYLVAENWNTGEGSAAGASALQLAIWHMWGFDNASQNTATFNADMANYDSNTLAQSMVQDALTNGQSYSNSNVLWVYNSPGQNQIMFITPEGQSLALLLPGLIPVGFAIRRKLRKA